ncbi:DUF3788 family protein [Clostridium intestinale]|uniref:DUF3788 family protein n=1 Tax=Clostridium intestinale TaxID=36845 RepID=A0A7D6VSM7_9CLOT|nr:DUF3788 family protein [Clostridium intestinale]
MLNRTSTPTEEEIFDFIGVEAKLLFEEFEQDLIKNYHMQKELRFPFGNNYGWDINIHINPSISVMYFLKVTK